MPSASPNVVDVGYKSGAEVGWAEKDEDLPAGPAPVDHGSGTPAIAAMADTAADLR